MIVRYLYVGYHDVVGCRLLCELCFVRGCCLLELIIVNVEYDDDSLLFITC